MFASQTYINRRNELKKLVGEGIIFLPGNNESPMNYPANPYKFRQDSNFLYYFGLDSDMIAGVIDIDNDEEIIFGNDREIDDVVWMGPTDKIADRAAEAGVKKVMGYEEIQTYFEKNKGRKIHFVPQYRHDLIIKFTDWLGMTPELVKDNVSTELIKSIIKQRSIKSSEEVDQIEKALAISYEMNTLAMRHTKPGTLEREIYGAVEGLALGMGNGVSFPTIFSVNGEILHNHQHENIMKEGDLVVLDSGAESELHYASDITRSFPVSGKFTERQKEIYQIVLDAQLSAIEAIMPGIEYKDVHKLSAKVVFDGLKSLGITKGDSETAVNAGAHALFFPHGLGHMMGLDVHDMEGLGENYVGYDEKTKRSEQFGLAYLRFAKNMQPGHVLTVEPGIYFIPKLIEIWESEKKHEEYINYDRVKDYIGFGGIRIEDNVLVTETGHEVLGKPIPKSVTDVEAACAS